MPSKREAEQLARVELAGRRARASPPRRARRSRGSRSRRKAPSRTARARPWTAALPRRAGRAGGNRRRPPARASRRRRRTACRTRAPGSAPNGPVQVAVRAQAEDHGIALAPARDEGLDQLGRVLQVGVHDDGRTPAGMVQPGGDRDLLAEVPAERDGAVARGRHRGADAAGASVSSREPSSTNTTSQLATHLSSTGLRRATSASTFAPSLNTGTTTESSGIDSVTGVPRLRSRVPAHMRRRESAGNPDRWGLSYRIHVKEKSRHCDLTQARASWAGMAVARPGLCGRGFAAISESMNRRNVAHLDPSAAPRPTPRGVHAHRRRLRDDARSLRVHPRTRRRGTALGHRRDDQPPALAQSGARSGSSVVGTAGRPALQSHAGRAARRHAPPCSRWRASQLRQADAGRFHGKARQRRNRGTGAPPDRRLRGGARTPAGFHRRPPACPRPAGRSGCDPSAPFPRDTETRSPGSAIPSTLRAPSSPAVSRCRRRSSSQPYPPVSAGASGARGISSNEGFSGISPFDPRRDFADDFVQFLRAPGPSHLVMCHPGFVDAELERIETVVATRPVEHEFLAGPRFLEVVEQSGLVLARPDANAS